jgi:hypothetical protein
MLSLGKVHNTLQRDGRTKILQSLDNVVTTRVRECGMVLLTPGRNRVEMKNRYDVMNTNAATRPAEHTPVAATEQTPGSHPLLELIGSDGEFAVLRETLRWYEEVRDARNPSTGR